MESGAAGGDARQPIRSAANRGTNSGSAAPNVRARATAYPASPQDDAVVVENRRLIAAAIKAGFTINLSANNPMHADRLAELGIASVVTVFARAYARKANDLH